MRIARIGLKTDALPLTAHAQATELFFIMRMPSGNGMPMMNPKGARITILKSILTDN